MTSDPAVPAAAFDEFLPEASDVSAARSVAVRSSTSSARNGVDQRTTAQSATARSSA
jgi:hypothetical protein